MESGSPPTREIIQAEALAWMAATPAAVGTSVITSLPDLSEVPERGFDGWKQWFGEAARAVLRWTPEPGFTLFYQSDIRHAGSWVDKSYLVQRAAEAEERVLLWHKIVCRLPPGSITHGRASYSHLLCFAHAPHQVKHPGGPDVSPDAGHKPWSKAMGVAACQQACRFVRDESPTTTRIVDPFCGHGTVLAVANAYGFEAVGVDLSTRKVRAARRLELPSG